MAFDKRDIKRQKKRLQLRYGLEEPNKLGFTEDISATGIFIKTPVVMDPGKILFVEFRLADASTILVKGRIMWAKRVPQSLLGKVKGGMGVHILSFERGEEEYRQLCLRWRR
jgi:Tfp pilus assembly protein PilZ